MPELGHTNKLMRSEVSSAICPRSESFSLFSSPTLKIETNSPSSFLYEAYNPQTTWWSRESTNNSGKYDSNLST